jgi:hypothetical protein
MRPILVFLIAFALGVLIPALVNAQSPPVPAKSPVPDIPAKSTPLASPAPFASPQAQIQASPQQSFAPQSYAPAQSFAPQYDQETVVLRSVPQVYRVQRQVLFQAAPVAYAPVSYAAADVGCGVAQQAVVQRSFVQHQSVVSHGLQSAQVNHGVVANAAVGRQPKKIKTKQVTKVKRGLFGK